MLFLDIIVNRVDISALHFMKKQFGGSIKIKRGGKSYRYRIKNVDTIVKIIENIYMFIFTERRKKELINFSMKAYEMYPIKRKTIEFLQASNPEDLIGKSIHTSFSWFSGYFDGKGVIKIATEMKRKNDFDYRKPMVIIAIPASTKDIFTIINSMSDIFTTRIESELILNTDLQRKSCRIEFIMSFDENIPYSHYQYNSIPNRTSVVVKECYNFNQVMVSYYKTHICYTKKKFVFDLLTSSSYINHTEIQFPYCEKNTLISISAKKHFVNKIKKLII
jgi:hypothetical protein